MKTPRVEKKGFNEKVKKQWVGTPLRKVSCKGKKKRHLFTGMVNEIQLKNYTMNCGLSRSHL